MDDADEYGSQDEQLDPGFGTLSVENPHGRRARKGKRAKRRLAEYEDPSLREHLLAGAYGGVAQPKPKRAGVKYTTDIDAGLRDIATPGIPREVALPVGGGRRPVLHGTSHSFFKPTGETESQKLYLRRNFVGLGHLAGSEAGSLSGAGGNQGKKYGES